MFTHSIRLCYKSMHLMSRVLVCDRVTSFRSSGFKLAHHKFTRQESKGHRTLVSNDVQNSVMTQNTILAPICVCILYLNYDRIRRNFFFPIDCSRPFSCRVHVGVSIIAFGEISIFFRVIKLGIMVEKRRDEKEKVGRKG